MDKKALPIVLLCLMAICFVLTIALCVETGMSAYQLKNNEIDPSHDKLPGVSIIGVVVASLAIWGSFLFFEFLIASVGFSLSLINRKIASNPIIRRVSTVFFAFYSAMLIFVIGMFIYCAASIVW